MNILTFFGIVFVVLAVLCYLDYRRSVRRATNRRAWERYIAALEYRPKCEVSDLPMAQELVIAAYIACKDECPADLRTKLLSFSPDRR